MKKYPGMRKGLIVKLVDGTEFCCDDFMFDTLELQDPDDGSITDYLRIWIKHCPIYIELYDVEEMRVVRMEVKSDEA